MTINDAIRLLEAKPNKRSPSAAAQNARNSNGEGWRITQGPLFAASLLDKLAVFPDLAEKLKKFEEVKKHNPLSSKYGKHDRPMTADLVGLWHCHLRDDAVLIYRLKDRAVHLIYIASHAELEGKRLKQTTTRLRNAGELPEGTTGLAESIIRALGFA